MTSFEARVQKIQEARRAAGLGIPNGGTAATKEWADYYNFKAGMTREQVDAHAGEIDALYRKARASTARAS